MRWHAAAAAFAVLLLTMTSLPGCLKDDGGDGRDLSGWELGMSVDKFLSNGARALNLTYLTFHVRWGPKEFDRWLVGESEGFKKGNESYFPFRLEASYDEPGPAGPDPFPIQGTQDYITGACEVKSGGLKLSIDGPKSTYRITNEYDRLPTGYEATVRINGTYGELVLYFLMLEPVEP